MQFFGGSEISPSPPVPTASGNNAHMMYIFNRNGVCLLYREWNRPLRTLDSNQDHKLMFGLLFSLKSLTAKMDPSSTEKGNLGVPQLPGQGCSFHSFRTNTYKLSFMESPSGIKIILVTHPKASDLRESLKYIYNLYVEYVVKNPLYTPGTPIRSVENLIDFNFHYTIGPEASYSTQLLTNMCEVSDDLAQVSLLQHLVYNG
ncbi:hypothetical protein L1987_07843 [Smallanthus sonchifolius]|uniref:Uncharacterized protein n=1 Tax=Smallanthus sonchifolius TaxID=185202 RepID=A0ACB9JIH4_9ASTR|nr:hypothetical protein L1987_07843 [Smallanthus sonchifolius]